MAIAGQSGDVLILALSDLRKAAVVSGYAENTALSFSRDGGMLAVSGYGGGSYLTSNSRLDLVPDYARERWGRQTGGGPIDWVRNGSKLAMAGPERAVIVDPLTGTPERRLNAPPCLSGGSIQDLFGRAADGSISALYMPTTIVKWRLQGEGECVPIEALGARLQEARLVDADTLVGYAGGRMIGARFRSVQRPARTSRPASI